MIELNEEQRLELSQAEPMAIDPSTDHTYVLVRKSVYDRIKGLVHESREWADGELRILLAQSADANGWNEPEMNEYDDYDANRTKTWR